MFCMSLRENCSIYVELQKSGKRSLQSHSSTGVRADMAGVLLKPRELERTRQLAGVATSTQGNQSVWCASHRSSAQAQLGVRSRTIAKMWQSWADVTFFLEIAFFSLIGNEKRHLSLLFAYASDPNPSILFFFLIRVLRGRCATLKMDASYPNINILFSY